MPDMLASMYADSATPRFNVIASVARRHRSQAIRGMKTVLCLMIAMSMARAIAFAQDGEETAAKSENPESRAEALKRVESLNASVLKEEGQTPLRILKDPILIFSDPTRKESAGTVWAIGDEGRPKAVLSLFTISGEKFWSYEFTSLTPEPLVVAKSTKWSWKPKTSGLASHELKTKVATIGTAPARLTQMKQIARDFTASEVYFDGRRNELRLLQRPLYRYVDDRQGIIDGAIFAMANGTNPEILLFIELMKGPGEQTKWQYGVARMSSAELHLMFDQTEVWTAERSKTNATQDPYYSRRESPPPPGFE